MKVPTQEDLAYMAGFFDGEGCVGLYMEKDKNGKRYPRLSLRVSQIDRRPLLFFLTYLGGHVMNWNGRVAQWGVKGEADVQRVAALLMPYMKVKGQELQEKLNDYSRKSSRSRS